MKRIAILTGVSSGMGRELALQLAQWETFDELWVIARRADRLEALKEQVPSPLRPISLDLTDAGAGALPRPAGKRPAERRPAGERRGLPANSAADQIPLADS